MKFIHRRLAVLAGLALAGLMRSAAASAVPGLDELAADWMEVGTLRNFPSVNNFAGGLQSTPNLTAFQSLVFPPYAHGGWSAQLLLDGKLLTATESRWHPCEVRRRVTVQDVVLESALRMPFEQQGVLTRLTLQNKSPEPRTLNLGLSAYGRVRLYEPQHWRTWGTARPGDGNFTATAAADGRNLLIADQQSPAVTAYAFVQAPSELKAAGEKGDVRWTITLPPGKSAAIEYVYAVGRDAAAVAEMAARWAADFNAQFDLAQAKWEERWQAAFTPGNTHFSGHIPTLITDDARIRRVYYHGALVPLELCRTTYPYSPRCFVTAGPEWADTLVYFWDTEMWANTWAMLEPVTMKAQLARWFSLPVHGCYAVDCLTGQGAGPWYAANDWSIFRCVEAYLSVTGDWDFLGQDASGKTLIERCDELATFYQKRPLAPGSLLADFGGPANLLECSPSYVQGVPSLNAAAVYMLRRTAEFHEKLGHAARARELRDQAAKLLPAVLALYEPGQGVWSAVNKAGQRVPIRHCYDYITIGQALENCLTPEMKSEMNSFVIRELLTASWMRAMSLQDPAAAHSDRPDHGPMGSYDAWPPMTMDVLGRLGDFRKALDFLRATEVITRQGPWSQAHEFLGPDARGSNPVVRTAHRGGQDANEGCGAAFAEVIIRSFFGFRPDLSGDEPALLAPSTPRGFVGELSHVPYRGALYRIASGKSGLKLSKEPSISATKPRAERASPDDK